MLGALCAVMHNACRGLGGTQRSVGVCEGVTKDAAGSAGAHQWACRNVGVLTQQCWGLRDASQGRAAVVGMEGGGHLRREKFTAGG